MSTSGLSLVALSEVSGQKNGSYVHPCASINLVQEKMLSIVEESATHRQLEVETHPLVRKYNQSTCCTEAYEHQCTGPETHVVHRPIYNPEKKKGHRISCNICSGSDSKRRAHRAFHELHGFNWKILRFIDLTTPEDFITPEDYENKEALDKKVNLLFSLGNQFMKKEFPNESYVAHLHTQHSADPLSKPHFHLHIESSCTEYHHDRDGLLSVKHLNGAKSKNDLESMRSTWAGILGYEGEVDLHYAYAPRRERVSGGKGYGGPKRVMHRLSYCYRGFIEDVNKWLTQNNIHSLDTEQEYWLQWHLQKWPRTHRRYGAWSPSKQSHFVDMSIIEKRIEEDRERTRRLYCPICSYELENKSMNVEPVPLNKDLLAVREIIHMKRPPSPCMFEKTPVRIWVRSPTQKSGVLEYQARSARRRDSEVYWGNGIITFTPKSEVVYNE